MMTIDNLAREEGEYYEAPMEELRRQRYIFRASLIGFYTTLASAALCFSESASLFASGGDLSTASGLVTTLFGGLSIIGAVHTAKNGVRAQDRAYKLQKIVGIV